MIAYNLQMAWQNLRRNAWLSALIVLATGVGIGSSMTVYSLLHAMASDPIPHKSGQLFAPRLDTTGPRHQTANASVPGVRNGEPHAQMTFRDAIALHEAGLGVRQAVMFGSGYVLGVEGRPTVSTIARATHADFFGMFDVPFVAGESWGREEDAAGARVVVLAESTARRVFGVRDAQDTIDKVLTLDGHSFKVIGIVRDWGPTPRFYDVGYLNSTAATYPPSKEEVFLPLLAATGIMGGNPKASFVCQRELDISGAPPRTSERWLEGECLWTHLWVELPTRQEVGRFDAYLREYAVEQQRIGRVDWLPETRLHDVPGWLDAYEVVPDEYRLATILAAAFFAVCLLNAMALMLALWRQRSAELALRRALGASRGALFAQYQAEALVLGLLGAALGLVLAGAGVLVQRVVLTPELAQLAGFNSSLLASTLAAGVGGTMLAGLLPAWRVATASMPAAGTRRASRLATDRLLMGIQVAATLALMANCLFVAWQKWDSTRQPINADVSHLFTIVSQWDREYPDLHARIERDLAELRETPGIVAASAGVTPLRTHAGGLEVSSLASGRPPTMAQFQRADEQTLETWDARLLAGRWFRRQEVGRVEPGAQLAVISRTVAEREFGSAEDALERILYFRNYRNNLPVTVIGVIDNVPGASWMTDSQHLVIYPVVVPVGGMVEYVVRAARGSRDAAMSEAVRRLLAADRSRAIGDPLLQVVLGSASGAVPLAEFRDLVNKGDRGLALMLLVTATLLLLVACLGVIGMTSNWLMQRRRQIGVRRALGATRSDILRQFQIEGLRVVLAGVVVGAVLALAANLWLVGQFEMARVSPVAVAAGALLILVVSQLAAFWPALSAARVPPAVAARAG